MCKYVHLSCTFLCRDELPRIDRGNSGLACFSKLYTVKRIAAVIRFSKPHMRYEYSTSTK